MPTALSFEDFMRLPAQFYKSIGHEQFPGSSQWRSALYKFYFYLGMLNFNFCVVGEFMYFGRALQSYETVLNAIAVAPCIGFSLVADFKQAALTLHKRTLRQHLCVMARIYPDTVQRQHEFDLSTYKRTMQRNMIVLSLFCLAYTSTFSFYPACRSFVRYYVLGVVAEYERIIGFRVWYPYDITGTVGRYALMFVSHIWAGYYAGVVLLSADLLLIASVTQLSMHFNHIANCLRTFEGERAADKYEQQLKQLTRLVHLHAKCLEQSELINEIFGFSMLLNFLIASLTICFLGFQVTASTAEDIIVYGIFLLASLVQVFIICYYGDQLITASSNVGDAAYSQHWFDCDVRYKRLLIVVIARSQNPASIRPPTFPPISFNTYMKVISMSYQFFALLRTTYYKE